MVGIFEPTYTFLFKTNGIFFFRLDKIYIYAIFVDLKNYTRQQEVFPDIYTTFDKIS